MATQNLTFLSSPGFPQRFSSVIERQLAAVDRILTQSYLSPCCYESPETTWGACDGGFPCSSKATVQNLASEQEYCLKHFQEVK